MSLAAHLAVILALTWQTPPSKPPAGAGPVFVALMEGPPLPARPSPPAPPDPSPPKASSAKAAARTAPAPRRVAERSLAPVRKAADARADTPTFGPAGPSEAELAQATTAASAPRGGACNMTELVQTALRTSRHARAAMAGARQNGSGRAVMVWNGSWVRSSGEDGDGLAGLREVMITEIAFAPKACQAQTMHGLVLISLADGPLAPRVVLGAGNWRWSDLLMAGPAFSP